MTISAGETLGKYRLIREIGRGAMGTVWHAEHPVTERQVAVKVISDHHLQSPEMKSRMLKEARACGRLADLSPHIVGVLDAGETEEGAPFLVMELLEGESVADRLAHAKKLAPAEAAEIAIAIARGLAAAHRVGVVHRDLKPANVFLHRGPEGARIVKVVDFGISKVSQADELGKTDTGKVVGSPAYMSPEQAEGRPNLDAKTDLWSFGVVLYELLTGELAFRGDTPWSVVADILRGDIPDFRKRLDGVDPRLIAVVEQCVVRDPAERIASAEAVVALLLPIVGGTATTALSARASVRPRANARVGLDDTIDPTGDTVEGEVVQAKAASTLSGQADASALKRPRRSWVAGGLVAMVVTVGTVLLIQTFSDAPGQPTGSSLGAGASAATPSTGKEPLPPAEPVASAVPLLAPPASASVGAPVVSPMFSADVSAAPGNRKRAPTAPAMVKPTAPPVASPAPTPATAAPRGPNIPVDPG